jgi:hypothetical protein
MQHYLNYLKHLELKKETGPELDSYGALMIQIQTTMRPRTKRKVNNLTIASVVMLLAGSGLSKILQVEMVTERLNRLGVGKFMIALGIIELVLAALFISSRTMKLSFILLSCYFSGAIATEISHSGNFIVPFIFMVLIWTASFIRERSILKLVGDINSQRDQNPWNVNWMLVE